MKDEIPSKTCRTCGRELPRTEFTKNIAYADNCMPDCKECRKAIKREKETRRCAIPLPWYLKNDKAFRY